MPTPRTRSLSTKVTPAEYEQVERLAGEHTISAWTRSMILKAIDQDPAPVTMMAEVIAVRRIVLSLLFAIAKNGRITEDTVYQIIDDAEHDKLARAHEQLAATRSSMQKRRSP